MTLKDDLLTLKTMTGEAFWENKELEKREEITNNLIKRVKEGDEIYKLLTKISKSIKRKDKKEANKMINDLIDKVNKMTPEQISELERKLEKPKTGFLKKAIYIGTIGIYAGIITIASYFGLGNTNAHAETGVGYNKDKAKIVVTPGTNVGVSGKEMINLQDGGIVGKGKDGPVQFIKGNEKYDDENTPANTQQTEYSPEYKSLKKEAEKLVKNKSPPKKIRENIELVAHNLNIGY